MSVTDRGRRLRQIVGRHFRKVTGALADADAAAIPAPGASAATPWPRWWYLQVAVAAIVLAIALPASATYASGASTRPLRPSEPTLASVLRPLTPGERRYVLGIMSLTPLKLWAAFGTSPTPPSSAR